MGDVRVRSHKWKGNIKMGSRTPWVGVIKLKVEKVVGFHNYHLILRRDQKFLE
jgi:hypothetical protein